MRVITHEAQRSCSLLDQLRGDRDGTGGVFHRDKIPGHSGKIRPGIGIGEKDRKPELTDEVGIAAVKHFDTQDTGGVFQNEVGGQAAVLMLICLDLVDHQGITRTAHPVCKTGNEIGAVVVPAWHAQGQKCNAAPLRCRRIFRHSQLTITHLASHGQNLLACDFGYAAPVVKHF